jgi:predicted DNA-binding transcriptional regulator YafY
MKEEKTAPKLNAVRRRLRILQLLPHTKDGTITVPELIEILKKDGFDPEIRAVQRDMEELREDFPISSDESSKPYHWYWHSKDLLAIPAMGKFTALALQLTELIVKPLLPEQSLATLETSFSTAKSTLADINKRKTSNWLKKIRVVPRNIEQIKAPIKNGVYETVSNALYDDKQLSITYLAASSKQGKPNTYDIHPYGLLHDGIKTTLIGKITNDKKIRPFHLHRIHNVEILSARSVIPKDFDLDSHVKTETAFPLDGKEIELKAKIHKLDKNHVIETLLSSDQTIENLEDGSIIVTATVIQTITLKRWILGFGEFIEILEPSDLRKKIKKSLLEASVFYK